MNVTKNKVVAIEYDLKNEQGMVLDSNKGFAPLEYLHGACNIVIGLEAALIGLAVNENIAVTIPPELGFGVHDPRLIHRLPIADYASSGFTDIGDIVQLPEGQEAIIISKEPKYLMADANHPLAGRTLCYEVTIKDIRDARPDELNCGYPLRHQGICSGKPGCC